MRELLNRRPDQPMPPGQHEKLRADLLTAIETEQARTPRRVLVPVAAAAAVLMVAAGLAVAVPALRNNDSGTSVAGQGALSIRELSAQETAELQAQCLAEADRITLKQLPRPFRGYTPVRAFQFTDVQDPRVVNTWLITKGIPDKWQDDSPSVDVPDEEGYWLCSRTKGGVISESSIRQGDHMPYPHPVWRSSRNSGVLVDPVVRVTVQEQGKAEADAYLANGFWFAPTVGRTNWGPHDADDPSLKDFVVRGYDAGNRMVYDSADLPTQEPCMHRWVDPNGNPVGGTKTPTLPYCKTYDWSAKW
ncbi:hypothetical protein GCM10009745_25320 [Kribbella yunnanensis]|uniref:Uncharacterized protein n=1 Tax=Kribbella yunnanensis TaxID=190194 RepID=A0ABN2H146_9ACTN